MKYLIAGYLINLVTGLDDTLTHVPIMATLANKKTGKIVYSIGFVLAIIVAIIISILFASVIHAFKYQRLISASLIIALALCIIFDVFVHKPRKKVEQKLRDVKSWDKYSSIFFTGFITALATGIDDIAAYTPLFLDSINILAIIGIILATLTELVLVIYFADKIAKLKHKDYITAGGLFVVAILILTGVL